MKTSEFLRLMVRPLIESEEEPLYVCHAVRRAAGMMLFTKVEDCPPQAAAILSYIMSELGGNATLESWAQAAGLQGWPGNYAETSTMARLAWIDKMIQRWEQLKD